MMITPNLKPSQHPVFAMFSDNAKQRLDQQAQDAAMQRVADAAVEMLSGMVAARDDHGMSDDEIKASILDSLRRMAAK